jgi:TatA/E family protein of Tat protein translocase
VQLGPAEILVVLVIALLVFGPTKLPEVGRQVGRAMKEFRQFQQTMTRDMHDVFSDDASAAAEPPPTLPPKAAVPDTDIIDVSEAGASSTEPATGPATDGAAPRPGESTADPETSA